MKTVEQNKREMYACLDKIRRAKKHPSATAAFENALEAYLDSLHRQYDGSEAQRMREERDQIQERLHAVDSAYAESQRLNQVAGEELRDTQACVRLWKSKWLDYFRKSAHLAEEIATCKKISADQLIIIRSQREAYGELFMKKQDSGVEHPILSLAKAKLISAKADLIRQKVKELSGA